MKSLRKFLRLLAAVGMIGVLSILPIPPQSALALDDNVVAKVWPAVVQLGPLVEVTAQDGTKTVPLGWGSGTIVSPDGYILTNHHVVDVKQLAEIYKDKPEVTVVPDKLAVFLTKSEDTPPVPSFIAEIVQDSPSLDLSVIHITTDLGGKAVDTSALNLPFVPVGDSDKLKLGQKVHVFGYPGIGGDTITFTSGDVSGFSNEAGVQGRAWIKTSASISGGNSGGTAVDDVGNLVGIPTQAGSGQVGVPPVDCRPYMDSNGDGKVDSNDLCIPIGGFINALRPVNLAKPLIAQATKGIEANPEAPIIPIKPAVTPSAVATGTAVTTPAEVLPGTPVATPTEVVTGTVVTTPTEIVTGTVVVPTEVVTGTPQVTPSEVVTATVVPTPAPPSPTGTPLAPLGNVTVSRLFFANGVNDDDQPVSVVTALPTESRNLILFFDYKGFEDGAQIQRRVFIDDQELAGIFPELTWSTDSWGSFGKWWSGWKDADSPLRDGTYKFQLEYNGHVLGAATIKLGGKPTSAPAFNLKDFTSGGETGFTLAAGSNKLVANLDVTNMKEGTAWTVFWYKGNEGAWQQMAQSTAKWNGSPDGPATATLNWATPLEAGIYRLEVRIGNQMFATADITLIEKKQNATFGPITFAEDVDANQRPIRSGTSFQAGIKELYACFAYEGMEDGMSWTTTWLIDNDVVATATRSWTHGASGTWDVYIQGSENQALPAGHYEVRLALAGKELQRADAVIGATRPPPPTPTPPPSGVWVHGRILDGLTGQPIEHAVFAVLQEDVTWARARGTDDEIYTYAYTDRRGEFVLDKPLMRGAVYSVGAAADGYTTITQDNVEIANDLPDRTDIQILLQPEW